MSWDIVIAVVAVVGWLLAFGFAWSSFDYFCTVKELREKIARLEKEASLPVMYNEYPEFDEPVPLGQIGYHMLRALRPKTRIDEITIANEIIEDPDCVHRYTLYLDTSAGCFVRTIEDDAPMQLETGPGFFLKLTWAPIHIGKNLTIFEGTIVYDGVALGRIAEGRELHLCKGDQLRVDYTFTS